MVADEVPGQFPLWSALEQGPTPPVQGSLLTQWLHAFVFFYLH